MLLGAYQKLTAESIVAINHTCTVLSSCLANATRLLKPQSPCPGV